MPYIFLKTLRENRRGLFWWSLGLVAMVFAVVAFYPDFKDQTEFNELLRTSDAIKAIAPNVTSFTSPEGYMNSQLYALVAPLLVIIYATVQGTGTIAGEENRGTLPLLLANPVSRERIVCEKFSAIVMSVGILTAITFVATALIGPVFELDFAFDKLLAIHASLFLLGILYGALALLAGAAWGNRNGASGIVTALAVGAYLVYTLAPLSDAIEPYQKFSPFYQYFQHDPLSKGLDWGDAGILAALTTLFFVLAVLAFRRRDVRA